MTKGIKVQRLIGMAEETLIDAVNDEEALLIAQEAINLNWEETEVITHYKIVENYA